MRGVSSSQCLHSPLQRRERMKIDAPYLSKSMHVLVRGRANTAEEYQARSSTGPSLRVVSICFFTVARGWMAYEASGWCLIV